MPAFLPPLVFHPNVSQMNFSVFILKDGKVEYTESLQITATIFDGGQNVSNSITIFIHSTDCKLKVIRDCEGKKTNRWPGSHDNIVHAIPNVVTFIV